MKASLRLVPFLVGILLVSIAASRSPLQAGDNPNSPEETVKLVFIHHSTGGIVLPLLFVSLIRFNSRKR